MKKLIQTRFNDGNQKDNCLATVIACLMELDSPEDVIQVQNYFTDKKDEAKWQLLLDFWLKERGWEIVLMPGHLNNGEYYLVTGNNKRDDNYHVCVYRNKELIWDPHPSGDGLNSEIQFEYLHNVGVLN